MQFTICYLFIYFFEALIVFLYTSTIFQKQKRIIINISYILKSHSNYTLVNQITSLYNSTISD